MIYHDEKEIIAIHGNGKVISAVYRGVRLVWQAIRSCFGAGYWVNEKPWRNDEGWKN